MKAFIAKNIKYISFFCIIVVMTAIFLFSAQSAQESSKLSGRVVTVVLRIVMPNYDKLPFLERQKIKDKISYIVRKTAHFTEFAALGFFLMLYLVSLYEHFKLFSLSIFSWIMGTFYAVTDEIHQMFVTARYSSFTDVLIDSSGVMFGIVLLIILMKNYLKKQEFYGQYKHKNII